MTNHLMGLIAAWFLLTAGWIVLFLWLRKHKGNHKLGEETSLLNCLLALRDTLLALPETDRMELLRDFRQQTKERIRRKMTEKFYRGWPGSDAWR